MSLHKGVLFGNMIQNLINIGSGDKGTRAVFRRNTWGRAVVSTIKNSPLFYETLAQHSACSHGPGITTLMCTPGCSNKMTIRTGLNERTIKLFDITDADAVQYNTSILNDFELFLCGVHYAVVQNKDISTFMYLESIIKVYKIQSLYCLPEGFGR